MVGASTPATRPRSGQFAQRSAPRKSQSRSAVERIPPHYGPGRRAIEDKQTLKSHRHSSLVTSCSAFQNFSFSVFLLNPSTAHLSRRSRTKAEILNALRES